MEPVQRCKDAAETLLACRTKHAGRATWWTQYMLHLHPEQVLQCAGIHGPVVQEGQLKELQICCDIWVPILHCQQLHSALHQLVMGWEGSSMPCQQ